MFVAAKKYKMPSPYHQWKSFWWSAKNSNRHFWENAMAHRTLLAQQAGHYPQIIIWNSYTKRFSGRPARKYIDQLMKNSNLGIDQLLNTVESRELRGWFVMCVRRSTMKCDQYILLMQSLYNSTCVASKEMIHNLFLAQDIEVGHRWCGSRG